MVLFPNFHKQTSILECLHTSEVLVADLGYQKSPTLSSFLHAPVDFGKLDTCLHFFLTKTVSEKNPLTHTTAYIRETYDYVSTLTTTQQCTATLKLFDTFIKDVAECYPNTLFSSYNTSFETTLLEDLDVAPNHDTLAYNFDAHVIRKYERPKEDTTNEEFFTDSSDETHATRAKYVTDTTLPAYDFFKLHNVIVSPDIYKLTKVRTVKDFTTSYLFYLKTHEPDLYSTLFASFLRNYARKTDERISENTHRINITLMELAGVHSKSACMTIESILSEHLPVSEAISIFNTTIGATIYSEIVEIIFIMGLKIDRDQRNIAVHQLKRLVVVLITMIKTLTASKKLVTSQLFTTSTTTITRENAMSLMDAYLSFLEMTLCLALAVAKTPIGGFHQGSSAYPTVFFDCDIPIYGCTCFKYSSNIDEERLCIYHKKVEKMRQVETKQVYGVTTPHLINLYTDYLLTLHTRVKSHLNHLEERRIYDRQDRVHTISIIQQMSDPTHIVLTAADILHPALLNLDDTHGHATDFDFLNMHCKKKSKVVAEISTHFCPVIADTTPKSRNGALFPFARIKEIPPDIYDKDTYNAFLLANFPTTTAYTTNLSCLTPSLHLKYVSTSSPEVPFNFLTDQSKLFKDVTPVSSKMPPPPIEDASVCLNVEPDGWVNKTMSESPTLEKAKKPRKPRTKKPKAQAKPTAKVEKVKQTESAMSKVKNRNAKKLSKSTKVVNVISNSAPEQAKTKPASAAAKRRARLSLCSSTIAEASALLFPKTARKSAITERRKGLHMLLSYIISGNSSSEKIDKKGLSDRVMDIREAL